jgi:hypothetical protein
MPAAMTSRDAPTEAFAESYVELFHRVQRGSELNDRTEFRQQALSRYREQYHLCAESWRWHTGPWKNLSTPVAGRKFGQIGHFRA